MKNYCKISMIVCLLTVLVAVIAAAVTGIPPSKWPEFYRVFVMILSGNGVLAWFLCIAFVIPTENKNL